MKMGFERIALKTHNKFRSLNCICSRPKDKWSDLALFTPTRLDRQKARGGHLCAKIEFADGG